MSKTATIIIIALIILAAAGWIFFYLEMEEKKKEREKRIAAERANLKLILDSIQKQKGFSESVKQQLHVLAQRFENIDTDVTAEIAQAIQLLDAGQVENAIEDLAKIIEHLLGSYYSEDAGFKTWLKKQGKRKDLHHLITYYKEDQKINEVECQFLLAVKTVRNKEDHVVNLKLDHFLNASGLIVAIGSIIKIANIIGQKNKTVDPAVTASMN